MKHNNLHRNNYKCYIHIRSGETSHDFNHTCGKQGTNCVETRGSQTDIKDSAHSTTIVIHSNEHNEKQSRALLLLLSLCLFCCIVFSFAILDYFVYRRIYTKMHSTNLSELSAVYRNIQQLGFVKIIFLVLLSYQIVEAANYCSLCKNHIACHNNGVRGICKKKLSSFK